MLIKDKLKDMITESLKNNSLYKKQILIIEDDQILQQLLSMKLNDSGFNVYKADCAEDGLKFLNSVKIDVILLDLMLPNMPGEQFLKIIKDDKIFRDVPIIVMTVKSDEANINNCLDILKADKFLIKSRVDLDDVLSTVKHVLHI